MNQGNAAAMMTQNQLQNQMMMRMAAVGMMPQAQQGLFPTPGAMTAATTGMTAAAGMAGATGMAAGATGMAGGNMMQGQLAGAQAAQGMQGMQMAGQGMQAYPQQMMMQPGMVCRIHVVFFSKAAQIRLSFQLFPPYYLLAACVA